MKIIKWCWIQINVRVRYLFTRDEWLYEGDLEKADRLLDDILGGGN